MTFAVPRAAKKIPVNDLSQHNRGVGPAVAGISWHCVEGVLHGLSNRKSWGAHMAKVPDTDAVLSQIRGTLDVGRANARSVAALTENPGCTRRRVIDAAGVKAYELAERLGHPVTRGQSPFAITNGNMFEYRLKQGSDYRLLVEALKRCSVDLPDEGLVVEDLGHVSGTKISQSWLRARVSKTDAVLAKIARGDSDAPHLVDHPVLRFDLAGSSVFLEPDALAFRVGGELEIVEIKSYPIIDGQADPAKVSSTAGQSAVYLLALRATLERLGFDPGLLRWSVILVAPRNFGRTATAYRIPLRKKASALQRVLGAVPRTGSVLADLPTGFTLDVDPQGKLKDLQREKKLDAAVRKLPMLFVPDCLSSCDMARFCRSQAILDDEPSRLGRSIRDDLAGVPRLADALRLARGDLRPDEGHLADVAEALKMGRMALERARAMVPAACGIPVSAAKSRTRRP